jgi:hypothetical protein
VSRAFPPWNRSILTEMYLCHACSCHEIEDGNAWTGAQAMRRQYGAGHNGARRASALVATTVEGIAMSADGGVSDVPADVDIGSSTEQSAAVGGGGGEQAGEEEAQEEESVAELLHRAGLEGSAAVLVGLHTCGDLAADACRLFALPAEDRPRPSCTSAEPDDPENGSAGPVAAGAADPLVAMVLCGCCYGRLSEPANFPLSSAGQQLGLQLGYVVRDLATHQVNGLALPRAPTAWVARMRYNQAYRAVLEAWLRHVYQPGGVGVPAGAISAAVAAVSHGGRGEAGAISASYVWRPGS